VADELVRREPGTRVVFAGTPKGLESRLVPRAGYALELLPILPLNGVGLVRMLKGLLALPWGLLRSAGLVLRLRPAAVLGVGGYASGPVTLLAALLGVRAVVLEPNAKPGFTNRVLKPFVRTAACAYEEAQAAFGAKGVLTGNPVRGGFAALPRREHREPLTLLAFGGSQGSRVLNRALVAALPHLPGRSGCGSSIRRARRCVTRSRPPTAGRDARPRSWPSSTTWRSASPRPTSSSRGAGRRRARSSPWRERPRSSCRSPSPPTTTSGRTRAPSRRRGRPRARGEGPLG